MSLMFVTKLKQSYGDLLYQDSEPAKDAKGTK